jgi:LysR family transcriptional regulator, regulator of the ytmI operon
MDIQIIKTFFSILRNGSFQDAARELGYAQSTITNQIQNLEAELGVVLIDRSKKLQLTRAGEMFIEPARQLLADYENLLLSVNEFADCTKGIVQIGAHEPFASYVLPKILNQFRIQYPLVEIDITIETSPALNRMVLESTLDFAICTLSTNDSDMNFEVISNSPIMLSVPASHHLATKNKVYLHDLENERILLSRPQSAAQKHLEELLSEKIEVYSPVYITNGTLPLLYVHSGFGICFTSSIMAEPCMPGVILKNVEDLKEIIVSGILIKKNKKLLTPATRTLASYIKDHAEHFLPK